MQLCILISPLLMNILVVKTVTVLTSHAKEKLCTEEGSNLHKSHSSRVGVGNYSRTREDADKLGDLSSVPKSHMVEGEKRVLRVVF